MVLILLLQAHLQNKLINVFYNCLFNLPLTLQKDRKRFLNAVEYSSGNILNRSGIKNNSSKNMYINKYPEILFAITLKNKKNINAPKQN